MSTACIHYFKIFGNIILNPTVLIRQRNSLAGHTGRFGGPRGADHCAAVHLTFSISQGRINFSTRAVFKAEIKLEKSSPFESFLKQ